MQLIGRVKKDYRLWEVAPATVTAPIDEVERISACEANKVRYVVNRFAPNR
jgi:hypothetical protein